VEEVVEEVATPSVKLPVASLNFCHHQFESSANKKKLTYPLSRRRKRPRRLLLLSVPEENPLPLNSSIWILKLLCRLLLSSLLDHKPQPRLVSSFHLKITVCASYKLLCANPKKISTLRGTVLQVGNRCILIKLQRWRSKWVREVLLIASR
jgi:hypothetical protein